MNVMKMINVLECNIYYFSYVLALNLGYIKENSRNRTKHLQAISMY